MEEIMDYSELLNGCTIRRIYHPDEARNFLEGGLTIIFSTKDNGVGIIIFGYTELGMWIYYYRINNTIIKEDEYYSTYLDTIAVQNGFISKRFLK